MEIYTYIRVFGLLVNTVAVMFMTPFALTAVVSVATSVEKGEILFDF